MSTKVKRVVTALILVAICVCILSCGKSGTVEVIEEASTVTNRAAARQPVWFTVGTNARAEAEIEGWRVSLLVGDQPQWSTEKPPVCLIVVQNTSSNMCICWGGVYFPAYSLIELVDSSGTPVERTREGLQIGTQTNDTHIKAMVKNRFQASGRGRARTDGFTRVRPGDDIRFSFSIPNLYRVNGAGEYTLKVRTCVIERVGGQRYDPVLRITWLPAFTIPIQFHEADSPNN